MKSISDIGIDIYKKYITPENKEALCKLYTLHKDTLRCPSDNKLFKDQIAKITTPQIQILKN